jgi:hypothetical protein
MDFPANIEVPAGTAYTDSSTVQENVYIIRLLTAIQSLQGFILSSSASANGNSKTVRPSGNLIALQVAGAFEAPAVKNDTVTTGAITAVKGSRSGANNVGK